MLDFNTDDSQVLKFVYLIIVYTTSKKVYYHVYKTSVYILCLCLNAVVSSYTSLLVSLTYCLIKRNNLFHTIYYLKLFLKLWYLQMEDLIEHNDFHSTTYRCVIIHYCVFHSRKKMFQRVQLPIPLYMNFMIHLTQITFSNNSQK